MVFCDWLSLNVRSKHGAGVFKDDKVNTFIDADRPTPIFKKCYEWKVNGQTIAWLTCIPRSEALKPELCIVKFENWFLYNTGLAAIVYNHLLFAGLEFQGFSRLDLCYDFNHLGGGLHPRMFAERYLTGQYRKTDKCKVFTVSDNGDKMECGYLRFGGNSSELTYKLYNKSQELQDKKDKPYIRQTWQKNKLNEFDVWRLEFSLKGGAKRLVDTFTGLSESLNDVGLNLLEQKNMQNLYFALVDKYFDFRYSTHDVKNVSRLERVPLFKFKPYGLVIATPERKEAAGRSDKVFVKKLCFMHESLKRAGLNDETELEHNRKLIRHAIIKAGLITWAKYKPFIPSDVLTDLDVTPPILEQEEIYQYNNEPFDRLQ